MSRVHARRTELYIIIVIWESCTLVVDKQSGVRSGREKNAVNNRTDHSNSVTTTWRNKNPYDRIKWCYCPKHKSKFITESEFQMLVVLVVSLLHFYFSVPIKYFNILS